DWTPPSIVDTINDGTAADITFTTSATDLSANWSASVDPHSAIARYFYAIGTTPGAADIVNWTDNWFSQSVTVGGLSLIDGQTYYYSVIAEDGAGLQSAAFTSNGQTVQLLSTGIADQSAASGLLIHPNPFTGSSIITYQLPENSMVELSLTDVLGKSVLLYSNDNQPAGKYQFAVNSADLKLSTGMYFVKMKAGKEEKTIKIIVR
ncbi:MAG: T9SS type A sorting domain-containing protein, partial [Bacteroidota bacterium]|nr:T9SS type A sorting domain-containing protein [Bacteroidota bacterium]